MLSRTAVVPQVFLVFVVFAPLLAFGAGAPAVAPKLSAPAIVERNIAARGGQSAWHAVQALSWSGKMEAGGNNQRYLKAPGMPAPPVNKEPGAQVQLPFTLEMKRGHKKRLDLQFAGQTAVQIYDGSRGWKVRPFLNRHQVEPYTAEEAKVAADEADLDGLLMDYVAKGTRIEVEGMEAVDGKSAYKLKLTLKSGHVLHDWIDAQSFLEVEIEGIPRRLDGRMHAVAVHLRDYRNVGGVQIPHVIETSVQGVDRTEKIVIERATVNPHLDDSRFTQPV
jgi:outer membrane lipoprotein-sorting protein